MRIRLNFQIKKGTNGALPLLSHAQLKLYITYEMQNQRNNGVVFNRYNFLIVGLQNQRKQA